MNRLLTALALALVLPAAADAQRDVTRRAFTFLEDRLIVAVHAEAPGELQVVRGQRGRIEVAARARDGFAGFGLGGNITRELSLTAVGSEAVQYLVVVPEHVAVSVVLPGGGTAGVPRTGGVATYRWGTDAEQTPATTILPTTAGGLYIIHSGRGRSPAVVDVPDLSSIRSVAVRVEGDDFRVAASRPLALTPGDADRFEIRAEGEPLDLVIFVPRRTSRFDLLSGGQRLAAVTSGRPRGFCSGTVLQQPTPHQDWLTVFPTEGRVACR
ncbi:MAG TPA: hypothetical protein VFZ24_06725 [Longimicrobiales bacterium]